MQAIMNQEFQVFAKKLLLNSQSQNNLFVQNVQKHNFLMESSVSVYQNMFEILLEFVLLMQLKHVQILVLMLMDNVFVNLDIKSKDKFVFLIF